MTTPKIAKHAECLGELERQDPALTPLLARIVSAYLTFAPAPEEPSP